MARQPVVIRENKQPERKWRFEPLSWSGEKGVLGGAEASLVEEGEMQDRPSASREVMSFLELVDTLPPKLEQQTELPMQQAAISVFGFDHQIDDIGEARNRGAEFLATVYRGSLTVASGNPTKQSVVVQIDLGLRTISVRSAGASALLFKTVIKLVQETFPPERRWPLPSDEAKKIENLTEKLTTLIEQGATDLSGRDSSLSTLYDTKLEQLNNLETTYNEKLALHSAVTYWEARERLYAGLPPQDALIDSARGQGTGDANGSKRSTNKLSRLLNRVILNRRANKVWLVVIFALITLSIPMLGPFVMAAKLGVIPSKLPYWSFGILAVIFGLWVWMLRLSVRALLSDMHLEQDARTRKVMVQTYLALLKSKENPITERERLLVLEPLFRPITIGLLGEEMPPATMLEVLKTTLSRN